MRPALLAVALAGCAARAAVPPAPAVMPPGAPTGIEVRVIDRRRTSMEVCWRAPAAEPGRQPARTFEVVYARRPIDAGNFDDPMVSQAVPFTGRAGAFAEGGPAFAPGERVCQLVDGLYIETEYYFAVRAVGDPTPAPPPRGGPTS